MMQRIKSFLCDESGAETIEYAIVAGLIALIAVAGYVSGLGDDIKAALEALF